MAKYDVTYRCGHEGRIELYGPHKKRQWRLEQERQRLCSDCWRKERAEEAAKAARTAAERAWPVLEGTPKQITWAEQIRAKHMPALMELYAGASSDVERAVLDRVMSRTSAAEWIDTRFEMYNQHWLRWETEREMRKAGGAK